MKTGVGPCPPLEVVSSAAGLGRPLAGLYISQPVAGGASEEQRSVQLLFPLLGYAGRRLLRPAPGLRFEGKH